MIIICAVKEFLISITNIRLPTKTIEVTTTLVTLIAFLSLIRLTRLNTMHNIVKTLISPEIKNVQFNQFGNNVR